MSSVKRKDNANRHFDEELVSADSLIHVLYTRCGCKEVHLNPEQHDPPDFTVTIDGEPFPAEVTSIVSRQQYNSQCKEFCEAIRDHADSLGVLSGIYAFIISRFPRIPKPTSKNGRQLLEKAVAYVDASRQQASSPEVLLVQDDSGKISIEKISAHGSTIGVLWRAALREGNIQSQLAMMIQQAVNDKRCKLQDTGIGPQRAFLLLYDAFGYAQPIDAVAAMQQVNGYDWFHSIFWAASFIDRKNTTYPEEPGREGFFLYSKKPNWNRVGTVLLEMAPNNGL